jgi:hypothetical protein
MRGKILIAALLALAAAAPAWAQTNGTVAFTNANFFASDTDTSAVIAVALTSTSNATVTVDYRTRDGSATAGVDYTATTGTLTFASSPLTNTFDIRILTTNGLSNNKTINLELLNPTGPATLGDQSNATLTIRSTATSVLNFSAAQFRVLRRTRLATVTVVRSGDSSEPATVHYETSDGTARNGVDYVSTSGTLIFRPDETEKSFGFSVLETSAFGSNKTVNVELSEAMGGATLGELSSAEVLLVNDKTQTITFTNDTDDVVTMTLKHAGTMETSDELPPFDITLEGTDETSALTVKIKKAKIGGTGTIEVDAITSDAAVGTLDAPGVDLTGAGVQLSGYLRNLRVHNISDGASIIAGGETTNRTKIVAHEIGDDVSIDIGTRLSLTAARFGAGSIDAPSADNISIRGDNKQGIPGDFEAQVTLTGEDVETNQLTLGRLSVAGKINGVIIQIDDGSVGSISAEQMINTQVTVGYSPDNPGELLSGGDFAPDLTLQKVVVRDRFENSFLVAANIGEVRLGFVVQNNIQNDSHTAFGILADESIGSVTVKFPPFHWRSAGPSDQTLVDFHVIH